LPLPSIPSMAISNPCVVIAPFRGGGDATIFKQV
jgi:hypothetical protein